MMRALSVNAFVFLIAELSLFALLWLQPPAMNLLIASLHLVTALLAGVWLSSCWQHPAVTPREVFGFVVISISLLPVLGAILLVIIDHRQALRAQGVKKDLNNDQQAQPQAKDLLNYFTAPAHNQEAATRKTRTLLSSLDDEAYLGLLIASRHLPDKEAYALLSEALLSPFESARLMAYSLKGKLEEQLQNNLNNKLEALATAPAKRLSELQLAVARDYLHLCDVGVESSSKEVLLQQARTHCVAAIKADPLSGESYKTLCEVLQLQGHNRAAKQAKQHAIQRGIPAKQLPLISDISALS